MLIGHSQHLTCIFRAIYIVFFSSIWVNFSQWNCFVFALDKTQNFLQALCYMIVYLRLPICILLRLFEMLSNTISECAIQAHIKHEFYIYSSSSYTWFKILFKSMFQQGYSSIIALYSFRAKVSSIMKLFSFMVVFIWRICVGDARQ